MNEEQKKVFKEQAEQLSKTDRGVFAQVLRSKGFVWISSKHQMIGEWSQAGIMLSLSCSGPWMAEVPRSDWPSESIEEIERDFVEPYGDRRQEIVFIGINMQKEIISKKLDEALMNDEEMKLFDEKKFVAEDPFVAWPSLRGYSQLDEVLNENEELKKKNKELEEINSYLVEENKKLKAKLKLLRPNADKLPPPKRKKN